MKVQRSVLEHFTVKVKKKFSLVRNDYAEIMFKT